MKRYMMGMLMALAVLVTVPPQQASAADRAQEAKIESGKKDVQTPRTPTTPRLVNTTAGITVRWGKASYASGYHVYRRTLGTRWGRIATVTGAEKVSYTDKSVQTGSGVRYAYIVQAYNSGKVSSPSKSAWTVRMTAPRLLRPTAKGPGKMLVRWRRDKNASGYQIQYSTSSSFKESWTKEWIRSGKVTAAAVSGLRRDRTYHVRIRSYKDAGYDRHYSAWGSPQKVNIR